MIAQDQLSSIRSEAENTLLLEMQANQETANAGKSLRFHRMAAVALSAFIPLAALLVYLLVGTPAALVESAGETEQPTMQELVTRLEQRLADNPGDQEGWLVLAQTNMVMQRLKAAAVSAVAALAAV